MKFGEREKRKNRSDVSANYPENRRRVKNKRFSYLEVAKFLILYIKIENRTSVIIEGCKMDFFQSQSLLQAHQTGAMTRPPSEAHQQDALTGPPKPLPHRSVAPTRHRQTSLPGPPSRRCTLLPLDTSVFFFLRSTYRRDVVQVSSMLVNFVVYGNTCLLSSAILR